MTTKNFGFGTTVTFIHDSGKKCTGIVKGFSPAKNYCDGLERINIVPKGYGEWFGQLTVLEGTPIYNSEKNMNDENLNLTII